MFYSEMSELPLQTEYYQRTGRTIPFRKCAVEELVHHINQSGWGHIPHYEYPYFDVIIQDFREDGITYAEFLEEIVDTCREIYNDPDYDGDERLHQFLTVLKDVAVRRGQPDRFAV
jgi:hypothetical protein